MKRKKVENEGLEDENGHNFTSMTDTTASYLVSTTTQLEVPRWQNAPDLVSLGLVWSNISAADSIGPAHHNLLVPMHNSPNNTLDWSRFLFSPWLEQRIKASTFFHAYHHCLIG
jgi:hypothetical protein